eukprot:CAMPEP_0117649092 /NCGR_PEP_ID=MMETSP0804-20121206/778_1 /TAXON_ID=1074897 /ORGANISM="Tetraselmis astigmatica, Strain CCMP880" /LENGTH=106 /DNA_ID=CAMNT_0005454787 /DNA_START=138 /DNA_END=456 /DNA_ORIENTATION=-
MSMLWTGAPRGVPTLRSPPPGVAWPPSTPLSTSPSSGRLEQRTPPFFVASRCGLPKLPSLPLEHVGKRRGSLVPGGPRNLKTSYSEHVHPVGRDPSSSPRPQTSKA